MNEINCEDIINYMHESLGVEITMQDLTRPFETYLVSVCNRFLSSFGLEQTNQPSFPACQTLVEVSPECQLTINVWKKVSEILEKVDFKLTLFDFYSPTPKRVHALLMALCQYHARFHKIETTLDGYRQKKEVICEEEIRLQTELVESKSEYETVSSSLGTLNIEESDFLKARIRKVQDDLSEQKIILDEKNLQLKAYSNENREILDENLYYEIEIESDLKIASGKIIQSSMKTINIAEILRFQNDKLKNVLKSIKDLENKEAEVLLKMKKLNEDNLPQIICGLERIDSLVSKSEQFSKQIDDEIQKAKQETTRIESQIKESDKALY